MDNLLNVEQAADFVQLSKSTIYRYCSSGCLTHIKKSFGIRFYKQDLKAWLDKGRKEVSQNLDCSKDSLTKPPSIAIDKAKGGVSLVKVKKLTFAKNGEILNGTVYQRKTKRGKRWCINFIDPDGNRIRKVARLAQTEEEAMIVLQDEVQKAFDREYSVRREKEKVKFSEFTSIYIENYAKMKKKSWNSDKKYLKSQLIPFFGEMELSEIFPLHVNKFMVKRQRDGVKNSTINRELTVLKKMLNLAIEWQFDIKVNPVKKGNFFSEEEYKRDRVLNREEEARLFQAAAPHLKPILLCALITGMRYSEIFSIKWENCDFKNRMITIKAESSKSGKRRMIPINDRLFGELMKLWEINQNRNDFVFLYQDPGTGKLRPVKTVRRAFVAACRRAGIKNLRFHDLRHTFGSRLISKGADPVSVKDLLGHANLKTTEVYLHSSIKRMREAVALLDEEKAENLSALSPLCHWFENEKSKGQLNVFFSLN